MLDYLLHLNENKNIEIIIYAPDSLVPRVIGNPELLSSYVKVHISNPGASSDKELVKGLVFISLSKTSLGLQLAQKQCCNRSFKCSHNTPLLTSRLPIRFRIQFKIQFSTFRTLHCEVPSNITELL